MNHRKPNMKMWYSLGLTLLLSLAMLLVATGTAFARYRAERDREITFQVRKPEQIQLGTISVIEKDGDEADLMIFHPSQQLLWKTEDGVTKLEFVVTNGMSVTDYSARTQQVRIRMIGSLGLWNGTAVPEILIIPPQEDGDEEIAAVKATAEPLPEGTSLYYTYGEGWLYTFLDEEGKELTWELKGGRFDYAEILVTIDGQIPDNPSMLQPYVTAEVMDE